MINSPAFIFLLFIVLILSIVLVICSAKAQKVHNRHSSQIMMAAVISPNNQFVPPPMTAKPPPMTAKPAPIAAKPTPMAAKPTPIAPAESSNLNITSSIVPKT